MSADSPNNNRTLVIIPAALVIGFVGWLLYEWQKPKTPSSAPAALIPDESRPAATPRLTSPPSPLPPNTEAYPTQKKLPAPIFNPNDNALVRASEMEAIRIFPNLAINNSPMHAAYRVRYQWYLSKAPQFFSDANWPLILAYEVADGVERRAAPR
jgi:hypothetical protein